MTDGPVAFGPFVLDPRAASLTREGKPVALGQRALALLEALLTKDGPVEKAALMEAAWPGLVVEEGNLTVQIAALRKALGVRSDGQEWILTVPRLGYRLVRERSDASADGAALAFPKLAVLAFRTPGDDDRDRHAAAGIAQDLINALGKFRDFELVSGQAGAGDVDQRAGPNGGDASGLKVRYRLEGALQRVGGRVRITMQLVDTEMDSHIWTDRFDLPDYDLLAVQDEISYRAAGGAIAALQFAEIERANQHDSQSAYGLYLRGVSKYKLLTPEGHADGFDFIRRALEVEPRHARALSHGVMVLGHNCRMAWPALTADDRSTCASFIERAELGVSDDARVLAECASGMLDTSREYRRALELTRRACTINPFSMQAFRAFGVLSIHCGDLDEAHDALQHVLLRSPQGMLTPVTLTGLAHVAMIRGDYEEALSWAEKSLAVSARYDATYWMLIAANAHLGRLEAARRHIAELLRRVPNQTVEIIEAGQPAYDPTRIAAILAGLRAAGMP